MYIRIKSPSAQVMVDETLVKEEMIDQGDTGQEDMMDSGMDYGSVGSDSRLEGSAGGGTEEDHMLPGKYEPKANPSQQAIPEAVVEALAGPSGMQTVCVCVCVSWIFILLLLWAHSLRR